MRERVNYLGGEIAITAAAGQGTQIEVRIPIVREPENARMLRAKTAITGVESAGAA
jgi:signal transduction histidine kinase